MVSASFWSGKRVFVTGHTGFKGSWLCIWLKQMGAEVHGFSLPPPTDPSLFEVARISSLVSSEFGDITDLERLKAALDQAAPEIVLHLAAQSLVRDSYSDPVKTYATNVMGSVHLLEAVRSCPTVRAVVMVTSDKCYENREWDWGYRENEPMGGYDPYSNSKGCAELVTSAYRSSFFNTKDYDRHKVAVASARAGNVIGGGDWADNRLIPDFIRAMTLGQELLIRSPTAIRPWQHVLEPLSGYLVLAQRLFENGSAFSDSWNFGPENESARPVAWIAKQLTQLWGTGARWSVDKSPSAHEAMHLKLDISKAKNHLNWHPCWDLAETLHRIVTWHKAHLAGSDMHAICLEQLSAYTIAREQAIA